MTTITTPHNVDLVLGHGHCFDGFTSMWIVWLVRGDACEYKEVFYGDPPPDVRGRHVLIVDFAYDRDVLQRMASEAASILVLDHHATNERKLAGLPYALFDMERSGAMLAYDWCDNFDLITDGGEVIRLVRYVQDRDLWRWKEHASREISMALSVVPMEFDTWSKFACRLYDDLTRVIDDGATLSTMMKRQVETMATGAQLAMLGDQIVWLCNAPYTHASDLGNLLTEREGPGVAAVWRYDGTKQRLAVSLRSSKASGVDVAKLAERHGGGGHKHAAGFEVDGWPPTLPFVEITDAQLAMAERLARGEI